MQSFEGKTAVVTGAIGVSVLCPGFVNTNIFTAERNRPEELGRVDLNQFTDMLKMGKAMVEQQGKKPEDIAEHVFRSIRERRFYILRHEELDSAVRDRIDRVLARTEPANIVPR